MASGWLGHYLDYTKNQESPEVFHLWIGLSSIAAALRRRVWLDRGFYKLYPNLFVILVGPSGKQKKSTALNIGTRMVREVCDTVVLAERMTPEGMLHTFNRIEINGTQVSQRSDIMLVAPELMVMLGADTSQAGRMVAFLTTLYDSPDVFPYTTVGHGKIEFHNVYVTMAAATAKEWLRVLPPDSQGGFLGRVIFVYSNERKRIPRPTPTIDRQILVDGLRDISNLTGEMQLTPEAWAFFDDWYMSIPDQDDDSRVSGFYERIHDTSLKVAVCLAAARLETQITKTLLSTAINIVQDIAPGIQEALLYVGTSEHSQDAHRILNQLKRWGGKATLTEIMSANSWKLSSEDVKSIIETLKARGSVKEVFVGSRQAKVYTVTEVGRQA